MNVVDELVAEAAAANEAKKVYEAHMARVRDLLPVVRTERKDLTVVEIESLIGRAYDRGTISRLTAEKIGTSRPKTGKGSAGRRAKKS